MVLNAMLFTCVVCFVLPAAAAVLVAKYYINGKNKWSCLLVFVMGALVYIISEILVRGLLMKYVFGGMGWYISLREKALPYSVFLGISAALAQETARFLIFLVFYKKFAYKYATKAGAAIYGLGAGFAEAVYIVGIQVFIYLLLSKEDSAVLDEVGAIRVGYAGIERIVWLFMQIGFAFIIVNGISCNKKLLFLIIAFVVHAAAATLDIYLGFTELSWRSLILVDAAMALVICLTAFHKTIRIQNKIE